MHIGRFIYCRGKFCSYKAEGKFVSFDDGTVKSAAGYSNMKVTMPISFCLIFNRKPATCNGKEHCNLLAVIKRGCIKFFVGLRPPSLYALFQTEIKAQRFTSKNSKPKILYFFENSTPIISVSWKNAHKAFGGINIANHLRK